VRDRGVARVYAETLLRRAERSGAVEEIDESVVAFGETLDASPRLQRFLEAPHIGAAKKRELLRAVFADRLHPDVLEFLFLVVEKHREPILAGIREAWRELQDRRAERQSAVVVTATPIDSATLASVREALERAPGKTIALERDVDPSLLGGLSIRTGYTVIDGSLRSRIAGLRRLWKAAQATGSNGTKMDPRG